MSPFLRITTFGLIAIIGTSALAEDCHVSIRPENAVIVSRSGTSQAAEELQHHLYLVSGVQVPIEQDERKGAYTFRFNTDVISGNREACSWVSDGKETVFSGNAYFAVIDFLENAVGVRWPSGMHVSYEHANPVVLSSASGMWIPHLKIRTIRSEKADVSNAVFRARMRCGAHAAPKYGHAFTQYWTKYGKEHPEYFAMRRDGLRGPAKASPEDLNGNVAVYKATKQNRVAICCTSTGLVSEVVNNWKASGMGEYINICENDLTGGDSCHCEACTALDVLPPVVDSKCETHYADRYVYFGNRVLAAARDFRPDVRVCYYAYNATQDAPSKQRLDPATVIGLVPTIFSHKYIEDYVTSWKKAGAKAFFYRPNQHHYFNCPYLPLGDEEHFFEVFSYLEKQGTIGFDYDAHAAVSGGFEWFERYVVLHAMQDPSKPFSYWEEHYCGAYGNARDDVKAYYRYWREEVWNKRLEPNYEDIIQKGRWFNFGRGLLHNLKEYYTLEDFDTAEKFVAQAEARNVSDSQRELIRQLRIAHDHARLFYLAVARKSVDNTRALVAFRKRHGYPLCPWNEQYYGDVAGIKALMDSK